MEIYSRNPTEKEWEEILIRLTAFTRSWTRGSFWFRGRDTTTFLMGKEVEDYVYEAIGRHLAATEKYDPSKGELTEYLKYNVVKTIINNDVRKSENHTTIDIFSYDSLDEDEVPYSEKLLPYTAALFPDNIDYDTIKNYIEKEVQGDPIAENIFLGIYIYGMKRREIIDEFNYTQDQYNNGKRRLETIMRTAVILFNKNKQVV